MIIKLSQYFNTSFMDLFWLGWIYSQSDWIVLSFVKFNWNVKSRMSNVFTQLDWFWRSTHCWLIYFRGLTQSIHIWVYYLPVDREPMVIYLGSYGLLFSAIQWLNYLQLALNALSWLPRPNWDASSNGYASLWLFFRLLTLLG